jgi:hypothetical protein
MKTNFVKYLLVFALVFTTFSCADLDVKNMNEPDTDRVLATPGDLIGLAGGAMRVWSNAIQEYSGPALTMCTMADQNTCSWGNVGMKDLSSEPRQGFNNNITYAYAYVNRNFWSSSYKANSAVVDVLAKIEEGTVINTPEETEMIKAWCYFIEGVVHGYLGLVFDKANIIDETTDLTTLEYKDYKEVAAAGIGYLEKAIATINGTVPFVLPDGFIRGYNLTSDELKQLANSFAARILAYAPRNKADNDAVAWDKVLAYANAGINWDYSPDTDDAQWYDNYKGYGVYPGWVRVDHRILNLMQHNYPSRWPNDNVSWNTIDGQDPGPATPDDLRIADFEYLPNNNFRPERGYYHFSHYRYSRYDDWLTTWQGPAPQFRAWENELLKAEAMVRTGDVAGATAILNDANGARIVRGGLPEVAPANAEEALEIIFYERDVELMLTQGGTGFFDMRRRDMLQKGTILHFPVPAAELEIVGAEWYTISGAPDGQNISNGMWRGYDGLTSPPN